MSRFIFPYGVRFREDSRLDVFPMAELTVLGTGNNDMRALFHIDSGATTSMMPISDAVVLGVRVRREKKVLIRGVTGEPLIGFPHQLKVQLGDLEMQLPVIFGDNAFLPRILGREGVFDRFGIVFDEAKRRVAFLERGREQNRIDRIFE